MVRLSRFFLILLALIISAGPLLAAESGENHDFDLAMKTFKLSRELSERDFADFVRKYPASPRKPEAILHEAQAMLAGGNATNAIQLLATNRADTLAPQYLYWLGLAHFQNRDFAIAADTFDEMLQKYPNSPDGLDATIRQANAFMRLEQWPRIVRLLTQTNGLFQVSAHGGRPSETIAAGFLLLGEAQLALHDNAAVEETLRDLDTQTLNTQSKWQRDYLAARVQRAEGRLDDALQTAALLIATQDRANRAEGIAFQGAVLEQMGNLGAAANTYTNNLAADVPPAQQRHAILKLAEIDLKLDDKLPDAVLSLTKYLDQDPAPEAADIALLTLGEVRLKQALNGDTNLYENALAQFDKLITGFPNSSTIGKALLDRGWCLWGQGQIAASQEAFRSATDRLPFSEEQAEARFKWADTQFAAGDYAAAITNYNSIAEKYDKLPEARQNHLVERALYQSGRAALNKKDLAAANSALKNILAWYPDGFAGPASLLLTGQGLVEQKDSAGARALFEEFEKLYPANPLRSEVHLAIARSYEAENNWEAAITNYTAWTTNFSENHLMPEASFSLAWDHYMAGHETNALTLFTNFIARFPTNGLAARAQFWVGDYYFRQGNAWLPAEHNYQLVFQNTNWPVTELTYEARMSAGRAAMARSNNKQAITYFTNLFSADCPPEIRVRATFAYADATISEDSTNKTADLNEAIRSLQTIVQTRSNSWEAAQAWGRIGDCHFELGAKSPGEYTNATFAYASVLNAPAARAAAKSEARFNLARTSEKQAGLVSGAEQTALLKETLNLYLKAYHESQADGEGPSAFWTQKAGVAAAQIAETLQYWQTAVDLYKELKDLLPTMAPAFERKILKDTEHL